MPPPTWTRTACLLGPPGDLASSLRQASAQGFHHVELPGRAGPWPLEDLEALADSGLLVSSVALALPPSLSLADPDASRRREALQALRQQVSEAARLGAVCAVLEGLPPAGSGRELFAEAVGLLATHAAGRMVRLAVADPDADELLPWLEQAGSAGLGAGLILRASQDPGPLVRRAGPRLLHVRLQRGADVAGVEAALEAAGYRGILVLPCP